MISLFPDLLRAVITDIMLVLLLSTMATPKYKILFSVIIFVFHKWVSKLYHKVLDYWHIYIFTSRSVGRLLLEMENTCAEGAILDENGYPVAVEVGHGIGSKSVIAFAKKYDGELLYKIENGVFQVRLLV